MTKFANKSFSTPANSQKYVDNWDSVFNPEECAVVEWQKTVNFAPSGQAPRKPACPCSKCREQGT